jgi:hypothetical protein
MMDVLEWLKIEHSNAMASTDVGTLEDAEYLQAAIAELTRLREIVDRLPKTADGVPITPGMRVYCSFVNESVWGSVSRQPEGRIKVHYDSPINLITGGKLLTKCSDPWLACVFSTREAAEAAQHNTKGTT